MTPMDRDDLDRAVEALCEAYPKAFFDNPRQRRPLKHNIAKDIHADVAANPGSELAFYDIDATLGWYCSNVGYQKGSSVAGTARLSLNGTKAGTVTEAEAREALTRADAIFEQIETRKREQAEARGRLNAHLGANGGPLAMAAPRVLKSVTVDTSLDDEGLLASIAAHVTTLKTLTGLPDPALQKQLSRTVVLLLIDKLKALDARLSA